MTDSKKSNLKKDKNNKQGLSNNSWEESSLGATASQALPALDNSDVKVNEKFNNR